MTTERRSGTLSVIVPVLNEEGNIPELVRRLKAVLDGGLPFDVIFVDDGSTDRTPQILRALHAEDRGVLPSTFTVSIRARIVTSAVRSTIGQSRGRCRKTG